LVLVAGPEEGKDLAGVMSSAWFRSV